MEKKQKIGIIVGVVLIIGVIGIIGGAGSKKDDKKEDRNDDGSSYQDAVEEKCEDAGTVGNYVKASDYSIRMVTDSWNQYTGSTGMYDKDGNELVNYRWHGKDKVNNETVTFDCWVAGKEDHLIIYGYSIGDTTFQDWAKFEWYNKDGTKQED